MGISVCIATSSVNVDDAKEVGQLILKSMVGKSVIISPLRERKKQSLWHQKQQLRLMMSVCKLIHNSSFRVIAMNGLNEDPA